MTDEDQARFYQRQAVVGDEPPSEYGFVGRDLDILAIERQLLATGSCNEILVHGLAGTGKSTLLRHLAWWWKRTGLIDEAFVYSYEERAWTCGQIVSDLQSTLLTPVERSRAEIMPETAQLEQVAHLLRARRHLLVLDNAESITASAGAVPHSLGPGDRAKIRTLLGRLHGGQTLVIVGSRETEAWLAKESFGTNRYALPGLDSEAASELAELVLRHHGATHWLYDPDERAALQDLLVLLDGSPLSMTVVLPVLASDAPSVVLCELRAGETDADPAGKIARAVEYSHGKLSPVLQMSLLMLAPFESVIPIEVLGHYQERLLQDKSVQVAGEIDLERAVSEAVRVGLATPRPGPVDMVQVQPVLPYFLRNRLQDQTGLRDTAERAHYTLHCDLGRDVMLALDNGSDPRYSINAMTFMKASYSNFSAALAYGMRTGQPIIHLISVLARYLRSTHRYDSCRKLLEETIEAYPEPAGPAQKLDLVIAHTLSGDLAVTEHLLEDAKRHYGLALELLRSFDHPMIEAAAYRQLGAVASEERQYAAAESYYRQALEIQLANDSRADAASTHHQLGIMCQAQQRLHEADDFFKEALAIYQGAGNQRETGDVLNQLAQVAAAREKPSEAEEYYRRALSVYLDFDDQADAAKIYINLGSLTEEQGRIAEADTFYRRGLNIQLLIGDKNNAAYTYHNLGTLARAQGRHEEARSCYNRALEIYSEFRDQPGVAFALLSLGKLAQSEGRCQEAEENYQQALEIYQDNNDRSHAADTLHLLGQVAVMQTAYHEAEKRYDDALEIYREIDARFKIGILYQDLGSLLSLMPERQEEAERYHRDALSIQRETGSGHITPGTYQSAGIIAFQQQRYLDAEQMFNAALSSYAQSGNRIGEAGAYQNLGMVAWHQRLYGEAEEIYRKCLEICEDSGYREMASVAGTQLGVVLAKLERHAEATHMLIRAAVIYRTDKGEWEKDDMQWLRRERSALGSADFSQAIETLVPADLREEINSAIEAAEPPEEG
jgi:tetratricopeptide (TPR) repeat protein